MLVTHGKGPNRDNRENSTRLVPLSLRDAINESEMLRCMLIDDQRISSAVSDEAMQKSRPAF